MTLISVLLGLLFDWLFDFHREGPVSRWFAAYLERATGWLPDRWDGVGGVLALAAPPVLVVALLQWAAAPWLFGLASLALGVFVLMISLGPVDVADVTEDYVDARGSGDVERSNWFFGQLTGERAPDNPVAEGRRMAAAVLYQSHDNVFATIFWFCLLGPLGAVGYRTILQAAIAPAHAVRERPALLRSVHFVAGVLGWIPARLIAFGYAMTGSFDEALGRLRERFRTNDDLLLANRRLLAETGSAALRQGDAGTEEESPAEGERRSTAPADVVAAARGLAVRTGVFWLAVIALLTLGGWFG